MTSSPDRLEFTAPSVKDNEISEYNFDPSGTTVLAFFPGAFTEPCTDELCVLRDSMREFEELEAEVIGISVDTPFSLKEFAERNQFEFRLVSDHTKEIVEQYGVKTDFKEIGYYGIAERAVFIVNDGEIVYQEIMEDPHNLPDIDKLKQELGKI